MREGGESVYACPIGSLMLHRLQDFFLFFFLCNAVLESEVGWDELIERYDLRKSGNGSMSFRLYFHATDKT